MKPTAAPIRFALELTRDDDHSCRIRVLQDGDEGRETLIFEVFVAAEFSSEAQKQALRALARQLQWYCDPEWA